MTAKIINLDSERNHMGTRNKQRNTPCYGEERLLASKHKKVSQSDRETLAENLYGILKSYEKLVPTFKVSTLKPYLPQGRSLCSNADFYRLKYRVTAHETPTKKPLSASVNDYILLVEAFITLSNRKAKITYEELTVGTSFHYKYRDKGALFDFRQRAAVIYKLLMKEVKRLDEQYQILATYREINELVIKGLKRASKNPWPESRWSIDEFYPRYDVMLSDVGISKSLLKKHYSGDMCIQNADLDEFTPDEKKMISDAVKKHITDPEENFKRATTPMSLYHWNLNEPMSDPENIIQLPRFHLGELGDANEFYTWKEYNGLMNIRQKDINKPTLVFENWWFFLFIYPAQNGKELQVRIMGSTYFFSELDEDCIAQCMDRQVFPPNMRWRHNQVPPSFDEFLMAPQNLQAIIDSFESTIDDLKNHPLLIAKRNMKKATVAYIQKLETD